MQGPGRWKGVHCETGNLKTSKEAPLLINLRVTIFQPVNICRSAIAAALKFASDTSPTLEFTRFSYKRITFECKK